ncbi:MAG: LLM class flavin-dependent oxidoreductase [Candidatus Dormibacteraeota bacterium]|nr:LLM class flavin-dependent oxidoreductase [Candidatus Dormibacteraeota bacterium]
MVAPRLRRIGFFSYLAGDDDPKRLLKETIETFRVAEELGFDSVWVAQHHFLSRVGTLPSPLPFLAAVAARTSRIHLGTAVVILPAEQPVRLVEDASVVDLLSGGRLELGVGSGTDPGVFRALGVDPDQRVRRMVDGLTTLTTALDGDPLPTGQRVHPPAPGLRDRLWQGLYSPERAEQAARLGIHVLLPKVSPGSPVASPEGHAAAAEAFFRTWSRPSPGRVALSRPAYPSVDRATAIAELGAELRLQAELQNEQRKRASLPPDMTAESYAASGAYHLGSSEEVAASLAADPALAWATDLLFQVGQVGPGPALTRRALERLALEVAPRLGWRPSYAPAGTE